MLDLSPMFVFAGQKYIYLIYTGLNKKNQHFIVFQFKFKHTGCNVYIRFSSFLSLNGWLDFYYILADTRAYPQTIIGGCVLIPVLATSGIEKRSQGVFCVHLVPLLPLREVTQPHGQFTFPLSQKQYGAIFLHETPPLVTPEWPFLSVCLSLPWFPIFFHVWFKHWQSIFK